MQNRVGSGTSQNMGNNERFIPIRHHVIILPDTASEATVGGIFLPDTVKEKESFAMEKGTIIDIGPTAFPPAMFGDDMTKIPKVGDRVVFRRHSGSLFFKHRPEGGKITYRLMNDEDVISLLEEKEA